jgi:hypothetical protein
MVRKIRKVSQNKDEGYDKKQKKLYGLFKRIDKKVCRDTVKGDKYGEKIPSLKR